MGVPVSEYTASQEEVLRLYDRYRDCLLSKKYYATKLARWKHWTLGLDIFAAVAASAALVLIGASAAGHPQMGWSIAFGGAAAASTLLRPVLRMQDAIDHYAAIHFGYTELAHTIDNLVADIRRSDGVNDTYHQPMIEEISDRYRTLLLKDDPTTDRGLLVKFRSEVLEEVKTENLWLPAI